MGKIKVPFFRPEFSHKDIEAIADVLYSGHLTTGPRCSQFEMMFAERLGVAHAISTNSATAALHLALVATGIGPGDIVFVPTLAFAADVQVIEWQNATPILVDCEPRTLCIDPIKLRQTVERIKREETFSNSKQLPRAVIAIDYGGQMADYSGLKKVCKEYDMLLIEDAAHALPASWRESSSSQWHSPGAMADAACFSFYANKPITTGEGGMVITNNKKWADQMKSMRLHGFESMSGGPRQARQVVRPGFKYNLSDIAAALGIRQLLQLDRFYQARREIAKEYTARLSICSSLQLPEELPDRQHAWHLYVVRLTDNWLKGKRDIIMQKLYQRGVETSVHWYPIHRHQYFRERLHFISDLSVSEAIYPSMISLPLFPSMTKEDLQFVTTMLLNVLDEVRGVVM